MGILDSVLGAVGDIGSSISGFAPVGALLGGALTNSANQDLLQQQQTFSAAQANSQMQFQENMRATQYQTAVKDMEAAGLNPMLAYSQGGAGNLSGAMAASPMSPSRVSPLSSLASSAPDVSRMRSEIQKRDQEIRNLKQEFDIKKPAQTGAGMVDKGLSTIKDAVQPASEVVRDVVSAVTDKLPSLMSNSAQAAKDIGSKVSEGVSNVGGTIAAGASKLGSTLSHSARDAYDAVSRAWARRKSSSEPDLSSLDRRGATGSWEAPDGGARVRRGATGSW